MEEQFFFTTVAGLSMSIAGFASVIAWLREDSSSWDSINLWRVKTIVREAFTLVFTALALVPIYSLSNDLAKTTRLGTGLMMIAILSEMVMHRRPDPDIWQPKATWTVYMISSVGYLGLHGVNLALANLGFLQVMFLLTLISPAGIFYNFVRELGRKKRRDA